MLHPLTSNPYLSLLGQQQQQQSGKNDLRSKKVYKTKSSKNDKNEVSSTMEEEEEEYEHKSTSKSITFGGNLQTSYKKVNVGLLIKL